jgi:hypothetical protein
VEDARQRLKKPRDRQRQEGAAYGVAQRALNDKIGAEVFERQAESRRKLAAVKFVAADGTEQGLVELLVEAVLCDELARWIGNNLGVVRR